MEAYGINEAGQITGLARGSDLRYHAFLYENGVMQDLGVGTNGSFGGRINSAGHVTGRFETDHDSITQGRDHAFLYTNGTVVDLIVQFGRFVTVGGINDADHLVGLAAADEGAITSFIYSNGVLVMPDFGLPTQMADINNAGLIVGLGIFPGRAPGETAAHATLFRNGTVIDLGVPRRSISSGGTRLNDRGDAVGLSYRTNGNHYGLIYLKGRMFGAGTLPGDRQSELTGINHSRVAVGSSKSQDEVARAVIWRKGVLRKLNHLIPQSSGWFLHRASAINDKGQIVGGGFMNGEFRAFLLTPVK